MYFLPFLFGFLLLFLPENVGALGAPSKPLAVSLYVQNFLNEVDSDLTGASTGGGSTCDALEERRSLGIDLQGFYRSLEDAYVLPGEDLARSACFTSDVITLERYLASLFRLAMNSADTCDGEAVQHYFSAAQRIARGLSAIRRYGLDPRFTGTGEMILPSASATPPDDNALCPYNSWYASRLFNHEIINPNEGCEEALIPIASPSRLHREANLFDRIVRSIDDFAGLGSELISLRTALTALRQGTSQFVRDVSILIPPGPFVSQEPELIPRENPNFGESGCLGWPSDVTTGTVTGEGIPRLTHFPNPLTQELRQILSFLEERENVLWYEYVQDYEERVATRGTGRAGEGSYAERLRDINEKHLNLETFSTLAIGDPQRRMAKLANDLHARTIRLATLVVDDGVDPPENPSLRDFARRYATFLMRMCATRGCTDILLRTVELSLRNECFSSFLMHEFFEANPEAATLPTCQAIFVQ